ncbi:hypothetical protein MTAT_00050 [Moorella thermoacetica]|uniref:Glycosyltransferase RgtA/B/C/D-like domain-containing protein n=1 Tax=Neomoorella thermoacetica TaxID=1525 RepID=A0AAC9HJA1_NEOTH|nr:glycosyltransferase family 39 protein [Moorella thermoacetica]AOQ25197.1 hypothetical protein Maut_02781 [Moorella thermoacetica]OIQ58782.1 hypothetical protein MTIN_25820 [Moorella thermoacetica]TYL15272.1 hypothetical protein MTAT_00050 [Moorella thermoacetica]
MLFKVRREAINTLAVTVALVLIVTLALYLRLKFVFTIDHPPLKGFSSDAVNYDLMARQFLDKGFLGYMSSRPNAYITPGYPLFLALIYKLYGYAQGSPLQAVRVVQACLGTLTVVLLYLAGREVKNTRVGLVAALLAAIYPTFVWAPTIPLTEVVYTFFFMLYFYLQLRYLRHPSPLGGVLTGLIFGLAILVRPAAAPLIVVPFLYDFYRRKEWRSSLKGFLYTLGGFVAVMLPWWIRNLVTLHQFILLATQTWNPLLYGAFPYFTDMDKVPPIQSAQEALHFILRGFLRNPVLYLKWYTIGKWQVIFGNMWYGLDLSRYQYLRSVYWVHNFITMVGWLGSFKALKEGRVGLVAIFIFLLTAIQLMFIPTVRYAFTIMPFLMLTTAWLMDLLFGAEEAA